MPKSWIHPHVESRRDIAAGEELTTDYAPFELDPQWKSPWRCACGAINCRGGFTGRDFEMPELQQRYGKHFHPIHLRRIAAASPIDRR